MMADPARLSFNTITVRDQWSLEQCIEGCARHGIRGISPWRDKLAAYHALRPIPYDRRLWKKKRG